MPPRPRAATAASETTSDHSSRRAAPKAAAHKAAPVEAPAEKKAPAKKAVAEAAPQKAAPAKKAAPVEAPSAPVDAPAAKKAPAKKAVAVAAPQKAVPAKKATPEKAMVGARPAPGGYDGDDRFLAHQRELLRVERTTYLEQANLLQAEAESLVEEMEPGDVQFDEESGEGGTVTVDRERDLALSAQALAAVEEIDEALHKIETGRYGVCEGCGELITKPRLEALPYARLCIACKSGGLSRR